MATASYKAALGANTGDTLPANTQWVTPHFAGTGDTAALNTLANALATGLQNYLTGTPICFCRIYQDGAPKPNYPVATAQVGTGFVAVSHPRELALCLSFYASINQPRHRGRIYIPMDWVDSHLGSAAALGARPTASQIQGAKDFYTQPLSILNTGVWDWVVRSEKDATAYSVTNYYVDDEWDIQRRRGTKPTSRNTGTAP